MKIIIKNNIEPGGIYFISRKDNDDFDWAIYCLGMTHLFDDEAEPISNETKEMIKCIQPETWDANRFVELFNKVAPGDYKATWE